MSSTIYLPQMEMDIQSAVRADSFREADRTIDVVWTTGSTGRRITWTDGEFDEELVVDNRSVRLDRLNKGAPFLDSHKRYEIGDALGSVVPGTARIENGTGVCRVRLSEAPSAADAVMKIIEGTVKSISVGYRIYGVEKKERSGTVPLHRVTDWEPIEVSAVLVPFDPGAQIRALEDRGLFSCRVEQTLADINSSRRIRMQMQQRHIQLA